jgi:HlyD family secretion protein
MSVSGIGNSGTRQRVRRNVLWAFAVAALIGAGAWHRRRPPEVSVQRPARRTIEQTVVATGRVLSPAKVNLGVLVQGIVGNVNVEEGQHVNAGDLLLTLQDDEFQALAKQAKGNLGVASARLRQLGKVDAKLAKEQLIRADKELEKANLDHSRIAELARLGAIASSQLTDAEAAQARAKEQRESAAIRVAATASSGSESEASLASVNNAQGAVDYAKSRLKYSRIVAPAAGVILTRSVEPGDVVAPGKALLVLSRDGETRLLVQPDEHALSVLALGQAGEASAEAFPQKRFPVHLDWIAPIVDPSRGTIDVKFLVPSPPPYLKPEMTVQVTVHVAQRDGALVVGPELVYGLDSSEPYALRVRNNRLERVSVGVGLRSTNAVEIVSGLADDDELASPNSKMPALGAHVRPKAQK